MAVSSTKLTSTLILKVKTGTDAKGKDTTKNLSIRKVKVTAVDEDVFQLAQAVGNILSQPVVETLRQDVNQIIGA